MFELLLIAFCYMGRIQKRMHISGRVPDINAQQYGNFLTCLKSDQHKLKKLVLVLSLHLKFTHLDFLALFLTALVRISLDLLVYLCQAWILTYTAEYRKF